MLQEKTPSVYRDARFWMALASFLLLVLLAVKHYPLSTI